MTITAAGKINLNFQLTICSRSVKITNASGGIAQLGERLNGIQEVSGSIPLISTKQIRLESVSFRVFFAFLQAFYGKLKNTNTGTFYNASKNTSKS